MRRTQQFGSDRIGPRLTLPVFGVRTGAEHENIVTSIRVTVILTFNLNWKVELDQSLRLNSFHFFGFS
jgi:hypothetical protein